MTFFNALIRTHHITSRKKVSKLKQAARNHDVFALLRSGGAPGIMYVEGPEQGVRSWVDTVHKLRYKDYQLAIKPAKIVQNSEVQAPQLDLGSLHEVDTVKDFSDEMKCRGLFSWWRKGMGYEADTL
ncbi:hypothetical protein KVT40_004373 [Elsinoe batatas]|uniref:Uncharacterized protein n=1 Tax=Elsinoe batatas TaxID=2601811 RepID=A0A8K0PDV8_9PEZI|nr:hypothetical protein KVT40_004373 [Elsinoe batatas]